MHSYISKLFFKTVNSWPVNKLNAVTRVCVRLLQVLDASPFDHKMALGYLGAVSGMSQQTALEQMMRIEKNMGQHYKKLLVSFVCGRLHPW